MTVLPFANYKPSPSPVTYEAYVAVRGALLLIPACVCVCVCLSGEKKWGQ